MKKFFTLIAAAFMAVGANAQTTEKVSFSDFTNDEKEAKACTRTSTEGNVTVSIANVNKFDSSKGVNLKVGSTVTINVPQDEPIRKLEIEIGGSSSAGKCLWTDGTNSYTGLSFKNATQEITITNVNNTITLTAAVSDDSDPNFYLTAVSVTYGASASTEKTAAKTWNFTELSADDKANLNADATNWTPADFDGDAGWKSAVKFAERNVYVSLSANNKALALTDGILFARDNSAGLGAGQVVIKENVAINLTGSNDMIKLENLKENDKVYIKFYSNADESRGFNVTNATPAGVMSENKTDIKDAELTVAANGDVILKTTKSVNIQAITINAELPTITTGIQSIKTVNVENGAAFNLAGQKVSNSYKGVVIQNGKKMIQK